MKQSKNISTTLTSNARALLALQEVLRFYWLDIDALGHVSMLSVRARQYASNGKYWRWALRNMFPQHPFQVFFDNIVFYTARFCRGDFQMLHN